MSEPKLRFPEFQGDWAKHRFADFTYFAGKRNKQNLPLETYSITNANGFIAQKDAHDDFGYMKNADTSMYIIVEPNSFGYNPARINVGSLGYYNGKKDVIVSSLYEIFKTTEIADDKFIEQWFKTKRFQDWIEKLQEGSVRQYFYYDKLCEVQIDLPSIEEQQKIAHLLSSIDSIIAISAEEIAKLQELKKGVLQKMFPKKGSLVPEMRFPSYSKPWEHRKVGDILVERNEQAPKSSDYPLMAFIANEGVAPKGDRYDRSALINDAEKKLYKRTKLGDFIYSSNNLESGSIGLNKYGDASISPVYSIFSSKGFSDSNFIGYCLVRKSFINEMVRWRQGVVYGQWRIHESDFLNIDILIPSIEEQREIGNFFVQLDNLISLHQQELEKWKELKKGLLQQMFV